MYLFVGLGNPTPKYAKTRHNIGFMAAELLASQAKASSASKPQFQGELYKSSDKLILKPLTYMNLSGQSVRAVCDYYKPDEVVVIHDDIAIPLGSVRIKRGGGSGGHNGLKSIDSCIGPDYIRIRLGVGSPKNGQDAATFVLDDFAKSEMECVDMLCQKACEIALELMKYPLDEVTTRHTSKGGICGGAA
jgi:PTH1 family peptidyl-tRNA hydrolase